MAQIVGLRMPVSGICLFDASTQDSGVLTQENYGLGFYSTYYEKNTILKSGIIKFIVNKETIYKLIMFDHLVYNKDRNPGNLLVEFKAKSIYLTVIDHSHVFKNQTIWDKQCFKQGIEDNDFLDTDIMEYNDVLYSMFYRNIFFTKELLMECGNAFKKTLTAEILSNIISKIPSAWGVSNDDLKALKEYIIYRLNHIEEICDMIITFIRR